MKLMVKTPWLQGLPQSEVEKFKKSILSSKIVLDKVIEMCYNKRNEIDKQTYDYDIPSWSHKQAHNNGYKQALDDLIDLLTIIERP